jgi:hypothetical protein
VHYGDALVTSAYCYCCATDPDTQLARGLYGRLRYRWRSEAWAEPPQLAAYDQEIARLVDTIGVARATMIHDYAVLEHTWPAPDWDRTRGDHT